MEKKYLFLALFLISIIFFTSTTSAFEVPYEGMILKTEFEEKLDCEEDSLDWSSTEEGSFEYKKIKGDKIWVQSPEEKYNYAINLETRKIYSKDDLTTLSVENSTTTHWIDPNVEEGDTVQIKEKFAKVESTDDSVYIAPWGNIEAIRLAGEPYTANSELITRPPSYEVQPYFYYDTYSGILLKEVYKAEFELRNQKYGWVDCKAIPSRTLRPTEKDSTGDGTADLQNILANREDPLKKKLPLKWDLRYKGKENNRIKQGEPFKATVDAAHTITEASLFMEDKYLGQATGINAVFGSSGKISFLAKKDSQKRGNIKFKYDSKATSVDVKEEDVSRATLILNWLSDLFGGIFEKGDFNYIALAVTPHKVSPEEPVNVTLLVENTGNEIGTRRIPLKVNGEVEEEKEISLNPNEQKVVKFNLQKNEMGEYTVSILDMSTSFQVVSKADFEVESIKLDDKVPKNSWAEITAFVKNSGDLAANYDAKLFIDGSEIEKKTIPVGSGQTKNISFEVLRDEIGRYTIEIGNQTEKLNVVSQPEFKVTEVELENKHVEIGDTTELYVKVENTGGVSDTEKISVYSQNQEIASQSMTIEGDSSKELVFDIEKNKVGEFPLTIGNKTINLTVTPFIWRAETASYWDSYNNDISEETTFEQGETVYAVFWRSVAKGDRSFTGSLNDYFEVYDDNGEVAISDSGISDIQKTQDNVKWYSFSTNQLDPGKYEIKYRTQPVENEFESESQLEFYVE